LALKIMKRPRLECQGRDKETEKGKMNGRSLEDSRKSDSSALRRKRIGRRAARKMKMPREAPEQKKPRGANVTRCSCELGMKENGAKLSATEGIGPEAGPRRAVWRQQAGGSPDRGGGKDRPCGREFKKTEMLAEWRASGQRAARAPRSLP